MNTELIIAVIGIVAAIFGGQGFWSWIMYRNKNESFETKMLLGIAYSKLVSVCEKHLEAGHITTREFHELEHYLYEPYKGLGGNGTVENLFQQVKELPIVPDIKHYGGKKK